MSVKKEEIAQLVLDFAMQFVDVYLNEVENGNDKVIEGIGEFEKDGYVFKFEVLKLLDNDVANRMLLEDKKKRLETKVTPYSLCVYWDNLYEKKFGLKYMQEPSKKFMGMFKNVLLEFSPDDVKLMINWYMNNYDKLNSSATMPTLEVFVFYRRDIAFNCLKNNNPIKNKHENKLGVKFK